MTLTLTIGGVDRTDNLAAGSLSVKTTAYAQTGVLSCRLIGLAWDDVNVEDELVWADGATVIYGGFVRNLKRSLVRPGTVAHAIDCQDYTTLLGDDVCDFSAVRRTAESDSARIAWLLSTFGTKSITHTNVQTLKASMPVQDFTGKTLAEAIGMVLSLSAGSFYVDGSKDLHTFRTESATAPHGLSDAPDNSTTYGYMDLILPDESTGMRNAVFGIPVDGGSAVPTWYEDTASQAIYPRRAAAAENTRIRIQSTLDAMGAAYLLNNALPRRTGSLRTFQPGLAAGQIVEITSADLGLSAEPYRITAVTLTYPAKQQPFYAVDFGDPKVTLARTFSDPALKSTTGGGGGGGGGGGYGGGGFGGGGGTVGGGSVELVYATGIDGGLTINGRTGDKWSIWGANVDPTTVAVTGCTFAASAFDGFGIIEMDADTATIDADPLPGVSRVWLGLRLGTNWTVEGGMGWDLMNRTVASNSGGYSDPAVGWGLVDSGTWYWAGQGGGTFEVSPGDAVIHGHGYTVPYDISGNSIADVPATAYESGSMLVKWSVTSPANDGTATVSISAAAGYLNRFEIDFIAGSGITLVQISGWTSPSYLWTPDGTDLPAELGDGEAWWTRVTLDAGAGLAKFKYWKDGDAEPGTSFDVGMASGGPYYISPAFNLAYSSDPMALHVHEVHMYDSGGAELP